MKQKKSKFRALKTFLDEAGIEIKKYDISKKRDCIETEMGWTSTQKVQSSLKSYTGDLSKFSPVLPYLYDPLKFSKLLNDYCKRYDLVVDGSAKSPREVPDVYKELTLNVDHTHTGRDLKFFTSRREYMTDISGAAYMATYGISVEEAMEQARKVVPRYAPRQVKGVFPYRDSSNTLLEGFNTYVPPDWKRVRGTHTPTKLPRLFRDLVEHLFPIEMEREYFYAWLYCSLFERAPTFLVLCGIPGAGKNRLKIVLRALHGFTNTVDGKKSSLSDRFNSQFAESTLVWFDELKYDMDMENAMKELPNDSISIEKKGVDATRSTQLHASFVISNNKPRDNYIAFDARKFVALTLNNKRLEESMAPERIALLTSKVEKKDSETYDPLFLKKIAMWVKENADPSKFKNLEYRGPMFWRLAHTSMSRWQKAAAALILTTAENGPGKLSQSFKKGYGFKWSAAEEESSKKKGRPMEAYTDYSTVKHFFDTFRDGAGDKVFKTQTLKGDAMGDFYVLVVKRDVKILNEADVLAEIEAGNGKDKKESISKEKEKLFKIKKLSKRKAQEAREARR